MRIPLSLAAFGLCAGLALNAQAVGVTVAPAAPQGGASSTGVAEPSNVHTAPASGFSDGTGRAGAATLPPPAGSIGAAPRDTHSNAYDRTWTASGGVKGTSCTSVARKDGRC
jgi:hypothetical protein